MAYETNRFCWFGIISTDVDRAKAFYGEALGYKIEEAPMGESTVVMFSAGGVAVGHIAEPPMPGVPSHWSQYLRVEDVDKTAEKAVAAGGKVVVPAMDIPPGRFSFVSSPSGAVLGLFHEANLDTAEHHPGGPGSVHWTELNTHDVEADSKWLESTLGFTLNDMPMPNGKYYLLHSGGQDRGGMMKAMMEGAPSAWLSWVEVEDVDGTAGRVKQHGGNLLSDFIDMPGTGRMIVAQDPTGAVFGLIQPG